MSKDEHWITAVINKLPTSSSLELELKPVLEKLVREQLHTDLLKPGQLAGIAQRFLKYCTLEKPK